MWNNINNWINTWFNIRNTKITVRLNKIEFSNNTYLNKLTINNVNY